MPTTAATAAPPPQLAIAARIVERDDGSLQIGILPETSVRVADDPRFRQALKQIARGERCRAEDTDLLTALREAGLFTTRRPPGPFPVRVIGSFPHQLDRVLLGAGLEVRPRAPLALVLSPGELDRSTVDALVRRDVPHLIVRVLDGVVVLGPFVAPGATACLRCLDAHHADEDPGYAWALERYVHASTQPREDGCDDAPAPSNSALALAWAARDLYLFSTGATPTTWSSTITVAEGPSDIAAVTWQPHPTCGCRWQEPAD